MNLNSRPRPVSPIPDSARCSLLIKNTSVHGHYVEAIRDAASLPDLYGYLRKKFNWTRDTCNSISWPWFKSAAKTYHHTDNHLMKLVYDHLPTRQVKNKKSGQSWIPDTCKFCEIEPETFDHLLKCNHPDGQNFRRTFPQAVRQYCTNNGAPHDFQSTLVIAVEDWIRDKPPLQTLRHRPPVQEIAKAQTAIGWSCFFKGFLSQRWKQYFAQEIAYSETSPSPTTAADPEKFFAGLIKVFWTHQSQFWMNYQQTIHQPNPPDSDPLRLQELKLEVEHLYTLKNQVPSKLRDTLFPSNLSTFLRSSSIPQLQTYINTYKPSILTSIRTEKLRQQKYKPLHQYPGFTVLRAKRVPSPHNPPQRTAPAITLPPRLLQSTLQRHLEPPIPILTPPIFHNPYLLPIRKQSSPFNQPSVAVPNQPKSTQPAPPTQRERLPRKHSKWKPIQTMKDRFKAFFQTPRSTLHPNNAAA